MVTFGLDASHHQGVLDFARFRREAGIEFAFLKATEGSDFVDAKFAGNLAKANQAGLLTAAYHYVRSNATAAQQVANVRKLVPTSVPVIPDVEKNSGKIELTREVVRGLQAAGYTVPLLYLPQWYWRQIGEPSLSGLPPLWSSRYPDNTPGSLDDEWDDVPTTYWNGYGGLPVVVLQFTSSGRLPGYSSNNLDLNAYPRSRDELAALLGGGGTVATPNEIWMAGVWHHYPDTPEGRALAESFGNAPGDLVEEHSAAEWLTHTAVRTSMMARTMDEMRQVILDLQTKVAELEGKQP